MSSLIETSFGRGPTDIRRINNQRVTYIFANLEDGVALGDAMETIRQNLAGMALPEGFSIVYGGEYEEQLKAQQDFVMAIIMALGLIYMVMAAQFERFLDPLIVMFSVPLAVIGVVPALLLTGTTLNMQSFMGVVMLIGIVVNNAIVLVDYINMLRRQEGLSIHDAVIKAGEGEFEGWGIDLMQGIIQIPGDAIINLAQKPQREMEILWLYPAGTRDAAADDRQSVTHRVGQAESDEKAHGSTLP